MIPYGCKCILFKLDKHGNGQEIQTSKLLECQSPLSFEKFTMKMFRQMCILSGCDYLPSPSGLGIRGAYHLIKQFQNYKDVIQNIRENRTYILSFEYEQKFEEAEFTFLYQRVWNPLIHEIIHLHPLPNELASKDLSFLGVSIDSELGYKIAKGLVNPITHESWTSSSSSNDYKKQKTPKQQIIQEKKTSLQFTPINISAFQSKFILFSIFLSFLFLFYSFSFSSYF